MFFIYRGLGPLAIVAAAVPFVICAGLVNWNPLGAALVGGVTIIACGCACRHYGRKWNQGSGFHMLYWIPLEIWGWIYIVVGVLSFVLSAVGFVVVILVAL